jgi:hypothetical protein
MSSDIDSLSPQCSNPECDRQFDSVNDMVAVPGRGGRSPRHFCEDCAERIQRGPPMTDGGLIEYLIRAQCPNCEEITGFVEERVNPVALDTDVHLSAEFCPNCSFFVAGEAEWDIHEETRIGRSKPVDELWTDDGLYEKYEVYKDGEPVPNCFVLEPESDSAAREALIRYAEETDDEELADDLRKWVTRLCTRGE